MKIYRSIWHAYIVMFLNIVAFWLLVFNGTLVFEIWGQVDYMSKVEIDLSSIGILAHLPRYIVVYPAYLIAEMMHLDPNSIYKWYVYVITVGTSFIWLDIRRMSVNPSTRPPFVLGIPFILLTVVNGRFVFGLFGLSIILWVVIRSLCHRPTIWLDVISVFGLLFCSVSSGVFSVSLVFLILSYLDFRRTRNMYEKIRIWGSLALLCAPFYYMLTVLISRNLFYYESEGYGFFGLLSHGFGMVLNPLPALEMYRAEFNFGPGYYLALISLEFGLIPTLIVGGLTTYFGVRLVQRFQFPSLAKRGLFLSAIGGVFGFTTMFAFIFVLPICVNRNRQWRLSGE